MKTMTGLLLLTVALGAHAAQDESTPCDNVENDAQAQSCARYNKETAERELKAAYDDLVARSADQDNGQFVSQLAAAQALWQQLRDADCKVETSGEQPGSPAYQTAWNGCIAQHSDDRSEYLQSLGPQS